MSALSSDSELVSAYAAQGSESAFRALVSRHVDMVFATAMRQTGNAALAEEITQNVFISLARKAPRLGGFQTLGGWLFRTAVLETKACVRSELRRRRREETASKLLVLQREGVSPFAAMLPLLDEALLNLRQADRLALVLRFLEERSFREVGVGLGVDEEAARKRVSRAVQKVSEFFRQRGFELPAAGGASTLLASAVHAAPPTFATSAANAALSAGGAGGAARTALFHLMKLTKIQVATGCIVLAAIPLGWQHYAQTACAQQQAAIQGQLAESTRRVETLEAEGAKAGRATDQARAETAEAQLQLGKVAVQLTNSAARPHYTWIEHSPYLRVPKEALGHKRWFAIAGDRGQLGDQLKRILQMTGEEASRTQDAIDRFLASYEALEAAVIRRAEPTKAELKGRSASQVRVLDEPYVGPSQMNPLREGLFAQVTSILGADRAYVFTNSLSPWMPLRDDSGESGNPEAVYCSDLRLVFYQPKPGDKTIQAIIEATKGPQGFHREYEAGPDEIPPLYAPYVQDWIAAIRNPGP
jgi:RNA polymerase sigma factor (sigma-70 family)